MCNAQYATGIQWTPMDFKQWHSMQRWRYVRYMAVKIERQELYSIYIHVQGIGAHKSNCLCKWGVCIYVSIDVCIYVCIDVCIVNTK